MNGGIGASDEGEEIETTRSDGVRVGVQRSSQAGADLW
jgi:hypothetical protein